MSERADGFYWIDHGRGTVVAEWSEYSWSLAGVEIPLNDGPNVKVLAGPLSVPSGGMLNAALELHRLLRAADIDPETVVVEVRLKSSRDRSHLEMQIKKELAVADISSLSMDPLKIAGIKFTLRSVSGY